MEPLPTPTSGPAASSSASLSSTAPPLGVNTTASETGVASMSSGQIPTSTSSYSLRRGSGSGRHRSLSSTTETSVARSVEGGGERLAEAPIHFPDLHEKPLQALRHLHDSPSAFDDYISTHAYSRELSDTVRRMKQETLQAEEQLAESSGRLESTRMSAQELADLRETLATLQVDVDALEQKRTLWIQRNNPDLLIAKLRVAVRDVQKQSVALEGRLHGGDMSYEEFVKEYLALRTRFHERSLKLEQLKLEKKKGIALLS